MKNLLLILAILFMGVVSAQTTYYPQTGTDSETYTWDGTDTFTDGTDSWTAVGEYISQLDTYFQTAPPAEITTPVEVSGFYSIINPSDHVRFDYIEIGADYFKFYDCDGEVGRHEVPGGIDMSVNYSILPSAIPYLTPSATRVTRFDIQFQPDGTLSTPFALSNGGGGAVGWELIELIPSCAVLTTGNTGTTTPTTTTEAAVPRTGSTYAEYYDDIDFSDTRNLDQFVSAFLRDAELAGVAVDGTTGTIGFGHLGRSSSNVNIRGQAEDACAPGYTIQIDETSWLLFAATGSTLSAVPNYEKGNKLRLIYHELGHAILQLDHSCLDRVAVGRLMAGSRLHSGGSNPDYISASDCDGGSQSHSDAVIAAVGNVNNQWLLPGIKIGVSDLFSMVPSYQLNCGTSKGSSTISGKKIIYN